MADTKKPKPSPAENEATGAFGDDSFDEVSTPKQEAPKTQPEPIKQEQPAPAGLVFKTEAEFKDAIAKEIAKYAATLSTPQQSHQPQQIVVNTDKRMIGKVSEFNAAPDDPQDMLEIPVIFYSKSLGGEIRGLNVKGRNIPHPWDGVVAFKYHSTEKIGTGKNAVYVNRSIHLCFSKKELEWLRKHPQYGTLFSEGIPEDAFGDDRTLPFRAEALQIASGLTAQNLIQRFNDMGKPIPVGERAEYIMRTVIAENIAQELAGKQLDARMLERANINQLMKEVGIGGI